MKTHYRTLCVVMVFALGLGLFPAHTPARSAPLEPSLVTGEYKPGELLVRFNPGVSAATTQATLSRYDAQYLHTLYASDVQLWQVPAGQELALMQALNADPAIAYAEPNYIYHADVTPNDPLYGSQWGLTKINAPGAWDITTGSTGVVIAIIDTGVDLDHPDLAGKVVAGYDYIDDDITPQDLNGHGSHVAGIAAASSNNGQGTAGVSWGARIMPIRVLDASGSGLLSDAASGITWACAHGAKILNLSLGGTSNSTTLETAVNNAYAAGCLVVASAGNCGDQWYSYNGCSYQNQPSYPGAYENAFAVAATTSTDGHASFSTQGSQVDIAAPGVDIYSTSYNDTYTWHDGTSQAAPFVSGLAALVWSANPSLTVAQVRQVIETTAVELGAAGKDIEFGWGRINAQAAVAQVAAPGTPTLYDISNPSASGNFTVDWSDAANATSYQLQEDDNPDFSSPFTYYPTPSTQAITGKTEGLWYYRVRGVNAWGDSAWSVTRSTAVFNAPTLQAISNGDNDGNYLVDWSTVGLATGYGLEEDDNGSFTSPTVVYQGNATDYTVTWQPAGTWYYRVRATRGSQQTGWAVAVNTTVNAYTVAAPTLNPIDNADGDGTYTVTWTTVGGATAYILEESHTPYFTTANVVYNGSGTQFVAAGRSGGDWSYRVRAVAGSSSPWSARQTANVTSYIYLPLVLKNYAATPPAADDFENGDFEQGQVAWTEYSSNGWDLILNASFPGGVTPHSGSWATWLGGSDNEIAYIQQQVTVPASTPYLAYYQWIASAETTCTYDLAGVVINGSNTVDAYGLCDVNNTGGWVLHTVNLSAYAGQSVAVQIRVETDSSINSNLFIDDVTFQATGALQSQPHALLPLDDVVAPRATP